MTRDSQQAPRYMDLHNPFSMVVPPERAAGLRIFPGTDYGQGYSIGLTLTATKYTLETYVWVTEADLVTIRDQLNALLVNLEIERETAAEPLFPLIVTPDP